MTDKHIEAVKPKDKQPESTQNLSQQANSLFTPGSETDTRREINIFSNSPQHADMDNVQAALPTHGVINPETPPIDKRSKSPEQPAGISNNVESVPPHNAESVQTGPSRVSNAEMLPLRSASERLESNVPNSAQARSTERNAPSENTAQGSDTTAQQLRKQSVGELQINSTGSAVKITRQETVRDVGSNYSAPSGSDNTFQSDRGRVAADSSNALGTRPAQLESGLQNVSRSADNPTPIIIPAEPKNDISSLERQRTQQSANSEVPVQNYKITGESARRTDPAQQRFNSNEATHALEPEQIHSENKLPASTYPLEKQINSTDSRQPVSEAKLPSNEPSSAHELAGHNSSLRPTTSEFAPRVGHSLNSNFEKNNPKEIAATDLKATGNEPFSPRRETGIQLPEGRQSSGRSDGGSQLPDTKQSTGRSDTGSSGASNPNIRPEARNDANTAKLPDAKTSAGLDQKFGDKVNPPGSGGIPVIAPGLPDIFGGLRGDKDSRATKGDAAGSRDGKETRGEAGSKDVRGELGSKDGKAADGKAVEGKAADGKTADNKIGDGKVAEGKSTDTRTADPRNPNPEIKLGSDGRPLQQGGSNLVHDGGSSGIPSTRLVDADGKPIGRNELSTGGKPNQGALDANKDPRGDKPFILPPGSLPVPDLIGGIRNIRQNLDPRIGRAPVSDETGKTSQVRTDATKPDGTKYDGTRVNADGTKTVFTGSGRANDMAGKLSTSDAKGVTDKTSRGDTQSASEGIRSAGDGIKIANSGVRSDGVRVAGDGIKSAGEAVKAAGDGVRIIADGVKAIGDGVKTIVTGGIGLNTGDAAGRTNVPGTRHGSEIRNSNSNESAAEGKTVVGKQSNRSDTTIVPQPSVQFGEMIGNLRAIASRIFPQDGRPSGFDNSLPGRKTERLDSNLQGTAGQRQEPIIPFTRLIGGERTGRDGEQFVIRLPLTNLLQDQTNVGAIDAKPAERRNIMSNFGGTDGKTEPVSFVDAQTHRSGDLPIDAQARRSVDSSLHQVAKTDSTSHHQNADAPVTDEHEGAHDDAAEMLLVNFELTGMDIDDEIRDEKTIPIAPIEQFGGSFERGLADEDDVLFDGGDQVAQADEQDTRYQYIVEAGDTIEMISIKVFKNVALAPLIYETNKDAIPIGMQDGKMSFILKVGMIIWLPFPREINRYLGNIEPS